MPTLAPLNTQRLSLSRSTKSASITLLTTHLNTRSFPLTLPLLKKHLPSIFTSECFNPLGLPFAQEVLDTQTGHLFEHILLEYLCQEKLKQGSGCATFTALTTWNWSVDQMGCFHIQVNLGLSNHRLLLPALKKSIRLFNKIIDFPRTASNLSASCPCFNFL